LLCSRLAPVTKADWFEGVRCVLHPATCFR
jgi:hypothetical protein